MNDAASGEPIEIRWSAGGNLAEAALRLCGGLALVLQAAPLWRGAPLGLDDWRTSVALLGAVGSVEGLASLLRAIDRRPKLVLTASGFACPALFDGVIAWSEVTTLVRLQTGFLFLAVRPGVADRLRWRGAGGWLRRVTRRTREPIALRAKDFEIKAAALTPMISARIAVFDREREARHVASLSSVLGWQALFFPFYYPELLGYWLVLATILLVGPLAMKLVALVAASASISLAGRVVPAEQSGPTRA